EKEFNTWSSDHRCIDNFIKQTQLNATGPKAFLQWIPFEKLRDVNKLGEGGFATVYSAKCIEGEKKQWDPFWDTWSTWDESFVALKLWRNSERICDDFLAEVFIINSIIFS